MNKKLFWCFIQSSIIISILWSCDAPRNNPLESYEPKKDTVEVIKKDTVEVEAELYVIDGFVSTLSNPEVGQSNVLVSFNSQQSAFTDDNGYYKLQFTEKTNGLLSFNKEGYHETLSNIIWGDLDSLYITKSLDREPVLSSSQFYSSVELEYYDQKSGLLYLSINIDDDNKEDISNISVQCSEFSLNRVLEKSDDNAYNLTINESDLDINNIDEVIGKDFNIVVKYNNSSTFLIKSLSITRVLTADVDFISPANQGKVTTSNPFFRWKRVIPGYDFHYILEVYKDTLSPELVWRSNNISSEDISDRAGQPIENGAYYWVIWVVDEFGNRIRSKPATFIVEIDE